MCHLLNFVWNSSRECMTGVHHTAQPAKFSAIRELAGAIKRHLQVRQNLLFEFHQHPIGDLDLQRTCNQNIRI